MLRKLAILLAWCAPLLAAPASAAISTYTLVLEGYQVVGPYVHTTHNGAGTATYDPATKQLTFNLQSTFIGETGAHINGPAPRGQNASVLNTLSTSMPKLDVVTLTPQQETMLLAGQLYVQLDSFNYPNGHLRAQIDNLGATVLHTLTGVVPPAPGVIQGGTEAGNNLFHCDTDPEARCSMQIPHGMPVRLVGISGAAGYAVQWGGDCSATQITEDCEFTMDADKAVSVTFVSIGVDLSTTLTAAPNPAVVGQEVTFTTTVHNVGPNIAGSTFIDFELPPGLVFVSGGAACTDFHFDDEFFVACDAGDVGVGKTKTFTFVLRATKAGTISISSDVSSDNPDYNAGNESETVDLVVNAPSARLVNISTRARVGTGDNVLIGGLIVGGSVNKTVVIRARGPSMVPSGITNPLVNPKLDLYSGQTVIATSDDWGGNANAAAVTASGFAPPEPVEAAILVNLAPGPYTAIVSGVGGTIGVGLVEVFEVDHPEVPLINIATRGRVQTGNDVMIAGFIIQGTGQQSVVVRARGPSLTATGVPGVLANPTLTLVRSSDGVVIAANDDWQTAANAAALTASGFAPADPKEAAILISLDPGAYTAIVRGAGETTGVAIVEVFRN